jgi:hypothetical protein
VVEQAVINSDPVSFGVESACSKAKKTWEFWAPTYGNKEKMLHMGPWCTNTCMFAMQYVCIFFFVFSDGAQQF